MKARTLLAGGIALVFAPVLMAQTPPSISSVVNLNPSVSLGASVTMQVTAFGTSPLELPMVV